MTASSYLYDHRRDHAARPITPAPPADAELTHLAWVRADRVAAGRQRREAGRMRDLTALLHERPDLDGVNALADFAVTYLRWCV